MRRHNETVLAQLSPAQRAYVVESYGRLLNAGRRIDLSAPVGNGGHPVLTFRRAGLAAMLAARPEARYSVHTHYHGDIRPDDPRFPDSATIVDGMVAVWAADPTTVFVLPQTLVFGAALLAPIGMQTGSTAWNDVADQRATMEEALQAADLDVGRSGRHVVSAHSAGGHPLFRVMAATADEPSHPRLHADEILVLDTVRGPMGDARIAHWWRDNTTSVVTCVDATIHAFSAAQAREYGWRFESESGHFEAVKRWFHHRAGPT